MITLFTTPKPFVGRWHTLQRNAIASWVKAIPNAQVILLGDQAGAAEAAADLGISYHPEVPTNEHGTPLVSGLFSLANRLARHEVRAYVNADMILLPDFARAVKRIRSKRFLMVGLSWGIEWDEPLNLARADWPQPVLDAVSSRGHRRSGMDYFVFTADAWKHIPDFAIGRGIWDQWLIFGAVSNGTVAIDASDAAIVVHQDHGWSAHPGGQVWIWSGPEIQRNRELAGELGQTYSVADATHRLTRHGVVPIVSRRRVSRALERTAAHRPRLARLTRGINALLHPRSLIARAD